MILDSNTICDIDSGHSSESESSIRSEGRRQKKEDIRRVGEGGEGGPAGAAGCGARVRSTAGSARGSQRPPRTTCARACGTRSA